MDSVVLTDQSGGRPVKVIHVDDAHLIASVAMQTFGVTNRLVGALGNGNAIVLVRVLSNGHSRWVVHITDGRKLKSYHRR